MIKSINSAFKGQLSCDIQSLKWEICRNIRDVLVNGDFVIDAEPSCDMDNNYNLQKIFGHGHIMLNSKNVEYEEDYKLSDYGDDAEQRKVLDKLKWEDIFIRLTIYRIGSYSYFNAELDWCPIGHKVALK